MSLPQMLARTARAPRTLVSAVAAAAPSSAIASTSRCFTTTGPHQGPKAAARAAKPKQKRVPLKKTTAPGGSKRKTGGGDEAGSGADSGNRFFRAPPNMNFLPTLTADAMTLKTSLNKVMAYSNQQSSLFEKSGLDKKTKRYLDSHIRPVTLIRRATADLISKLEASAAASPSPDAQPTRIALTGPADSGKSQLLLQAVSYALSSNWFALYLPRLDSAINATTGFAYSEVEEAYLLPQWTRSTLATILATNQQALKQIKVNDGKSSAKIEIQPGMSVDSSSTTLYHLLDTAGHSSVSPAGLQKTFDLLFSSISQQTDVPVLVALDAYQSLFQTSHYLTPDMEPLESYELAPVRTIIRFLGGWQGQGVRRGAVIGALAQSHQAFPVRDELQVAINDAAGSQGVALQKARHVDAYSAVHDLHLQHAKACLAKTAITDLSDEWTRAELAALYEVRRREGRNWNGGNAADADQRAAAIQVAPEAYPSLPGQVGGVVSEDELFLMRVMDSGGNPARFEAAIRGSSAI